MAMERAAKATSPEARDLLLFTRLLQAAEASGVNVPRALREVASRHPPGKAQTWALDLSEKMARGHSLGEAVRSLQGLDPALAAVLAVPGGYGFETVLTAYSRYLLLFTRLAEQIRTVVLYPLLISWIALLNIVLLNVFVFPAMRGMFIDQHQPLPWIVRLLFVGDPALLPFSFPLPAMVAALVLMLTHLWVKVPPQEIPATVFGRMFLLSGIARAERTSRFQFLIALFLRAGYRLTDAIRFSARLEAGDSGAALVEKVERLERGEDLAGSFGDDAVLMPIRDGLQSEAAPGEIARFLEGASAANLADAGALIRRVEQFGLAAGLIVAGMIVLFLTLAVFVPYAGLVRGSL